MTPMPAPRILIVDDQRDISRMLRAALGTLGGGSVILDVPSAEEAQLEMRREPIDLLITDLRLPGISGLELIRKLRRASSDAALIVISAYADELTQREIAEVGATFYPKPLSLEDFLRGVQRALGERLSAAPALAAPPAAAPSELAALLARLRRDLAASVVVLLDAHAQPVAAAGDLAALPLGALAAPLLTALAAGRQIGAALGGPGSNSLTYIDGHAHDLYGLRVGAHHALLIFYTGERGATQMGPVMRFGRQCADDLLPLLGAAPAPAPAAVVPDPRVAPPPPRTPAAAATAPLAAARPHPPAPPTRPGVPLTPAELQQLEDAAKTVTSAAAADFWDDADHSAMGDVRSGTLSFDEAAQRGLFKGKKS